MPLTQSTLMRKTKAQLVDMIMKQYEENDKVTPKIDQVKSKFDYNVFDAERNNMVILMQKQKEENETLKKENDKIKARTEEIMEDRNTVITWSERAINEIKQKYQEKIDDIADLAKELQNGYKEQSKEIEDLKKENKQLFQAWLHYWSDGVLGEEHENPMSEQENGKYQKLLDVKNGIYDSVEDECVDIISNAIGELMAKRSDK